MNLFQKWLFNRSVTAANMKQMYYNLAHHTHCTHPLLCFFSSVLHLCSFASLLRRRCLLGCMLLASSRATTRTTTTTQGVKGKRSVVFYHAYYLYIYIFLSFSFSRWCRYLISSHIIPRINIQIYILSFAHHISLLCQSAVTLAVYAFSRIGRILITIRMYKPREGPLTGANFSVNKINKEK